jgi:hypothetical protein
MKRVGQSILKRPFIRDDRSSCWGKRLSVAPVILNHSKRGSVVLMKTISDATSGVRKPNVNEPSKRGNRSTSSSKFRTFEFHRGSAKLINRPASARTCLRTPPLQTRIPQPTSVIKGISKPRIVTLLKIAVPLRGTFASDPPFQ